GRVAPSRTSPIKIGRFTSATLALDCLAAAVGGSGSAEGVDAWRSRRPPRAPALGRPRDQAARRHGSPLTRVAPVARQRLRCRDAVWGREGTAPPARPPG